MGKSRLGIVVGVGSAFIGLGGRSMAAGPEASVRDSAPPPDAPPSLIDARVTLDWSNRYFSGGLLHGAEGILLQPGAELGLTPDPDLGLRLFVGGWGSVQRAPAATATAPERSLWHEADAIAGLELTALDSLSLVVRYTAFTSPSRSFEHIHELALAAAWNDQHLWHGALDGRFGGLQPQLTVTFDAERADFTTGAGIGAELVFEPSLEVVRDGPLTLTLSLPLDIGLGLDGDGEGMASPLVDFAHAGLTLTFGLGFVPESAGAWSAKLTGRVLAMGGRTSADNGGQRVVALGSFGLEAGF